MQIQSSPISCILIYMYIVLSRKYIYIYSAERYCYFLPNICFETNESMTLNQAGLHTV